MKTRYSLIVLTMLCFTQTVHAELPNPFSSLFNQPAQEVVPAPTKSSLAMNSSPDKTKTGDLAQSAALNDADLFCQNPEASYSMWDTIVGVAGVAVQVGLSDLAAGGKADRQKVISQLREYSKTHLWLPTQVEDMYGKFQFEQRKKRIILRSDATESQKKLYERADRIFVNLMTYAPEKMPYDMRLYLLEDNDVQAEATPGGYVYITKGALAKFPKDDAMITFMLAHEISHISKRHLTKQFQQKLIESGVAIDIMQSLIDQNKNADPSVMTSSIVSLFNNLQGVFANYEIEQEKQADACAVNFSYSVSSAPLKGYRTYKSTRTRGGAMQNKNKGPILQFASHPDNKQRDVAIDNVVTYYENMRRKPDYKPIEPHSYTMKEDAGSGNTSPKLFGIF